MSAKNLKKVAFFHSHLFWVPHFETDLELINNFQSQNIDIISYVCNHSLRRCDVNINNKFQSCIRCILKRKNGLSLLNKKVKEIPLNLSKRDFKRRIPNSINEFKSLYYLNYDIGISILSSLISIFRDSNISFARYFTILNEMFETGIELYEFFIKSLKEEKPDLVFIFNGRFCYTRALLRACEALNIEYITHERGSSFSKYMLFENSMPHDLNNFQKLVNEYWDNNYNFKVKKSEAVKFFESRKKGLDLDWFSFVKNQNPDELPSTFDSKNYNLCIFLSSEDEFLAIDDTWKRPFFKNQIEGVKFILDTMKNHFNYQIFIRCHPNSASDENLMIELESLKTEKTTIINSGSVISSYKLLQSIDKAIVFGSTIGVEACYFGIPCINLDNSFYNELDVSYNPKSIEEIKDLLNNFSLEPKEKIGAYKYGFYVSSFGFEYKFYKPLNLGNGKINNIDVLNLSSIKMFIKNIFSLKKVKID
jgi:hypothetical protein